MLLDQIRKTIKNQGLLDKNDTVLIGVSGGPDSVALLYILNILKEEYRLKLHIAHLDHALRPASSRDKEFVISLAKKFNIPVTAARVKLPKGGSLEEVARQARIDFFLKVAKKIKAKKLALGHNRDDQAETVLMRILRGTGLYGLAGILPKRKIFGLTVIRPLIATPRKKIELFLKTKRIKTRLDETNLRNIYFRNKIRNTLLPLLEKNYNKNIKEALCNIAESAGFDYDYLNAVALQRQEQFGQKLKIKELIALHPAIRRLILRLRIASFAGDTRRLTFKHIREIEDLLYCRPANSIVDLPKGISAAKRKNYLSIYKR
ncbi:MAG: tRNA lysidine(34) synthetase TilS [Candidatus Omnitrophica bacterium]|nr:tRNA lysidine(34) synthetase TilS [Candidatus Omnitrophota bacterium]